MVTYVRTACRCCGEEIEWAPQPYAPRCDECRRMCVKPGGLGKPIPCRRADLDEYIDEALRIQEESEAKR